MPRKGQPMYRWAVPGESPDRAQCSPHDSPHAFYSRLILAHRLGVEASETSLRQGHPLIFAPSSSCHVSNLSISGST